MSTFEKYQAEAEEKWGQTAAYNQYQEKTADYSKEKWNDIAEGMDNIMAEFALCMKDGFLPHSFEAQDLVKLLKEYITDNYHTCTNDILAGLGQMYVLDERFKNNIDKHADGTAQFICDAVEFYCRKS